MDVASLVRWPTFLPIILLPSSYSPTHNARSVSWSTCSGGGVPTPMFCVLRPDDIRKLPSIAKDHAHLCTQYGRPACTQVWGFHLSTVDPVGTQNIPVGIIFAHPVGVFLANPVGTISYYISYYRPGLFSFDKTLPDRDYPRSRK